MTKKRNTGAKAAKMNTTPLEFEQKAKTEPMNPIVSVMHDIISAGAQHCFVVGMRPDETLVINSTLPSYEQMHALSNRGAIELIIAHNKYILSQNQNKEV